MQLEAMQTVIDTFGFQSSSSPRAGCNRARAGSCPLRWTGFNPHPARGPDATLTGAQLHGNAVQVSILIQPEGRMQPRTSPPFPGIPPCFNPHPARGPDATGVAELHHVKVQGVSILIQPEGRMQHIVVGMPFALSKCFNPHPARGPDATCYGHC